MSAPRRRKCARVIREADDVLLHGKPELLAEAGTQLTIDPTTENAMHALETGATLIVIGEPPTTLDADADYRFHDTPAGTLARLRDTLAIIG
jgi:NAD-dependent SIR2 family protein deacetylase